MMSGQPKLELPGKDNYGKPKQDFADALAAMSDADFIQRAEKSIWLSAYASNNRKSDYHWHADACYDEAQRRGKPDLYRRAWAQAVRSAS
jgi:hypothetical protein